MKALDIDVVATDAHHVPRTGPVLLAATHVSYPDFLFIEEAASRARRYGSAS